MMGSTEKLSYGAGLQGCPRNLRLQTFSMDGVMDGGYELLDGVV